MRIEALHQVRVVEVALNHAALPLPVTRTQRPDALPLTLEKKSKPRKGLGYRTVVETGSEAAEAEQRIGGWRNLGGQT